MVPRKKKQYLTMNLSSCLSLLLVLSSACGLSPKGRSVIEPTDKPIVPNQPHDDAESNPQKSCEEITGDPNERLDQIKEITTNYCFSCHNDQNLSGGISYDPSRRNEQFAALLRQGVDAIEAGRMPPSGSLPNPCQMKLMKDFAQSSTPKVDQCAAIQAESPSFLASVRPILNRYCISCHNSQKQSAGLDYTQDFSSYRTETLTKQMLDSIESGRMPLASEKPVPCEMNALRAYLQSLPRQEEIDSCPEVKTRILNYPEHVAPIINSNCTGCHSAGQPTSIRLDVEVDAKDSRTTKERWTRALSAARSQRMPPSGRRLNGCELDTLETWLKTQQDEQPVDCSKQRTSLRHTMSPLTEFEYRNTILGLFGPKAEAAISDVLDIFPNDLPNSYDGKSAPMRFEIVLVYKIVAESVANYFANNPSELAQLIGCMPDSKPECQRQFIQKFGPMIFRRPLKLDEIDHYLSAFFRADDDTIQPYAEAIAALLQTPDFLYKIEYDPRKPADRWEIGSRLAFAIWKSAPDQKLLDTIQSIDLTIPAERELLAQQMFDDPRSIRSMQYFFEHLMQIKKSQAFIQPDFFWGNLKSPTFHQDAKQEFEDFVSYIIRSGGGLNALFNSRAIKISSPNMSELYGLDISGRYQILQGDHATGILGRAAVLIQDDVVESPVKRGHKIREQILCDESLVPPGFTPTDQSASLTSTRTSTREYWEQLTHVPECYGCHSRMNPLGFAFQEYDSLGRHRETEKQYSDTGQVVAEFDLDLNVNPEISSDDTNQVHGARGLSQLLSTHPSTELCIPTKIYRYLFQQREHDQDRCLIRFTSQGLPKSKLSIQDMVKDFVMRDEFIRKSP